MAIGENFDAGRLLEQMERLTTAQRAVMLAGVVVAVIAIYWLTMYGSQHQQLSNLEQQLASIETKINESRAVASNLKSFKEKRESLQIELKQALRRLPDSKELPELLTDITSLGKKSGLEFRSFRPGKETSRGFYAEVPIKIEMQGRYHDLGVFLDRVSRLDRIVNVSDLTLKVASEKGDNPTLQVTGVATTFRFNQTEK